MTLRKRQKAQEVFQNTRFLFAKEASFAKEFPQIADIKVRVKETGEGVHVNARTKGGSYYNKDSVREFIDCSNPLCYKGGIPLGAVIRQMVSRKETTLEDAATCRGYEGSPKGRRKVRDCLNSFQYTVTLQYKDS